MIQVTGPDWPTTRALRAALAAAVEVGSIQWGASPCNKLEAFNRLRVGGVLTPIHTTSVEEARDWVHWGLQVWGRKIRHTQGKDIVRPITRLSNAGNPNWMPICPRNERWRCRDFWVQVLPSTREWRCHVWKSRAFRMGVKLHDDPAEIGAHVSNWIDADHTPVRSDRQGWTLCYSAAHLDACREDRRPIRDIAKAAIAALGIPGGAVDILEGPRGELTVLEVNTAPALGPNTLEAYVDAIRRGFQER